MGRYQDIEFVLDFAFKRGCTDYCGLYVAALAANGGVVKDGWNQSDVIKEVLNTKGTENTEHGAD